MERYKIEGFSKYSFGLDGSVYSIKSNHIGLYATPEEASAAYQDALRKIKYS